jgi:hypothetical protein
MSFKSRQNWSFSRFLTASLLFSASWAKPLAKKPHIVETLERKVAEDLLDKRQIAPFAVSGVSGGGVQPRLEIRQLMENTNQFNIYVLAIQAMQQDNQDDFLSYFSIAGNAFRVMKINYILTSNSNSWPTRTRLGWSVRSTKHSGFWLLPTHVQCLLDLA